MAPPNMIFRPFGRIFVCFSILSAVRKSGIKNSHRFANLRTVYEKSFE
jgi:hypothetical protein